MFCFKNVVVHYSRSSFLLRAQFSEGSPFKKERISRVRREHRQKACLALFRKKEPADRDR